MNPSKRIKVKVTFGTISHSCEYINDFEKLVEKARELYSLKLLDNFTFYYINTNDEQIDVNSQEDLNKALAQLHEKKVSLKLFIKNILGKNESIEQLEKTQPLKEWKTTTIFPDLKETESMNSSCLETPIGVIKPLQKVYEDYARTEVEIVVLVENKGKIKWINEVEICRILDNSKTKLANVGILEPQKGKEVRFMITTKSEENIEYDECLQLCSGKLLFAELVRISIKILPTIRISEIDNESMIKEIKQCREFEIKKKYYLQESEWKNMEKLMNIYKTLNSQLIYKVLSEEKNDFNKSLNRLYKFSKGDINC